MIRILFQNLLFLLCVRTRYELQSLRTHLMLMLILFLKEFIVKKTSLFQDVRNRSISLLQYYMRHSESINRFCEIESWLRNDIRIDIRRLLSK